MKKDEERRRGGRRNRGEVGIIRGRWEEWRRNMTRKIGSGGKS